MNKRLSVLLQIVSFLRASVCHSELDQRSKDQEVTWRHAANSGWPNYNGSVLSSIVSFRLQYGQLSEMKTKTGNDPDFGSIETSTGK
ncbi:hypothetical protein BaRGS_00025391 [Batillaria attramentaria]|uniref:Uncharacterized protein n=1 Tax=Batillaria attramentaria TaxID=370345 RepID=A0ABD0K8D1_9CAEN